MKNIVHVLQFCHGYEAPFLDCARQYATLFADSRYRVTTVYLTGKPNTEVVEGSASEEVIFLGYESTDIRGLKWNAIRDLRRLCQERNFSFCIAHRSKPTYVALLATALPVVSVHHAFGDYRRPLRRLLMQLFRHRLVLLGVSDAVRDDLRSSFPTWPQERIEALHNRIDVDTVQRQLLQRAEARAALDLPQDAWVIGNVGRLHPDKDQATLLRGYAQALPHLPSGSLLAIMGSGQLAERLKRLAADLGIAEQVRFLGQVKHGRRYFKAFDIFALTSDREPFGMVLLEAMAAGLPVICSDGGGGAEVVAGYGKLFPFGDAAGLAKALIDHSSNPDEALGVRADTLLRTKFSDTSAKRRFFALPAISNMMDRLAAQST